MSHHDNGLVALLIEPNQKIHDLHGAGAVKIAGWFVGKDHGGARDNGTSDRHSLLLTTRKLPWIVRIAICQADQLERFGDALMTFLA